MDKVTFQKATKKQARLRMAFEGPSGSGKTYTALILATLLAETGRIAVIDTEHGSSAKYADLFSFDILELHTFHPQGYVDGIKAAEDAGYAVIVIDSLSHAWDGEGGILELHEMATGASGGNSWAAWKDVTPIHRKLVEAMLQSSCHIIATMRGKTEYMQTEDGGKKKIVEKTMMGVVQRPGMEYEFDIVADMDYMHNLTISKTRYPAIADTRVSKPNARWFEPIRAWLSDGALVITPAPAPATTKVPAEAPKAPPTDGDGQEKPAAPAPVQPPPDWTRFAQEREAFKAFRTKYTLSDTECKRLAGKGLGQDKPLTLFREFPGDRAALELAILNQLEIESAKKETA